jgi:hypothetical protein
MIRRIGKLSLMAILCCGYIRLLVFLTEKASHFIVSLTVFVLAISVFCLESLLKRRRSYAARPRIGRCKCGYDLYKNVSGICPECGTPVQVPRHAADF